MQAIHIANYKVIKGTFPEIAEEAKDGMLTTFRTKPGFVRYGLRRPGRRHVCVHQSVGDTRGS